MNPNHAAPEKSLRERVLHALAFEGLAIALSAPALAWLLGKSLLHTGALTLAVSTLAMLWNMAYTAAFDRAQQRWGFERTPKVRVIHALLFELGLIVATVPLAAWWLSIGLVQAFVLDIGLLLFFLPYTLGFNWAYDVLRERWLARDAAPNLEAAARGRT
ncbi:multidrug/biocide efflux PACE transporter [Pseudoxanthomonas sp. 22568]|uniref:multidrug/biocide efflux PACE transporter n=1 Tax=Pseudoxanthomonas sp. 22568 TaxID=3453945 RepID=UPI00296F64AB|nr:multidrug/biocide efflux PACE transporter [Pseudoxanthomonas japonensis]